MDKHREQDKGKEKMRSTMCCSVNETKDEDCGVEKGRGERSEMKRRETRMKTLEGGRKNKCERLN